MLILVRHAETDWNNPPSGDPEILRGHMDPPLNENGRREAAKGGQQLCNLNVKYVAASHFSRDSETGSIIAAQCNTEFVVDDQLMPWNIGSLAGKYRRDVAPLVDWLIVHPDVAVPGGEPYGTFYNRFKARFVAGLRESEQDPSRAIVLIGQGNSFRALPAIFDGDDFKLVEKTLWIPKTMDMTFF